jgi:hypothetical protein
MSKVDDALNAGRKAVVQRSANLGVLGDPAGREHERGRLREMGKWRFILLRGIIGFSGPMFFWLVLTRLSEDIHAAREFHRNTLSYLLHRGWSHSSSAPSWGLLWAYLPGGDLFRKYGLVPSLILNPRLPPWVRSAANGRKFHVVRPGFTVRAMVG